MAKGLSDLQVSYLGHPSTPAPLGVSSFHQVGEGKVLNMFPLPPRSAVAGFLWPLLGIWKSLGNLKKIFLKSLSIAPQPCQGATAKRKKGRRGVGE